MLTKEAVFKVIDAYDQIYHYLSPIPVAWSRTRQRLRYNLNLRDLLPFWLYNFSAFFLVLMPRILQLMYLYFLYSKTGRFPSESEFATPLHFLSTLVMTFGSGGGPLMGLIAHVFAIDVVNIINSLIDFDDVMTERQSKKKRRKDAQWSKTTRFIVFVLRLAPLGVVSLSPLLCTFAVYKNVDPLYFLFKVVFRVNFLKLIGWKKLAILLIRFIVLANAALEAGKLLLGTGCILIAAAWLFIHQAKLLDYDYRTHKSSTPNMMHVRWFNQFRIIVSYMSILQANVTLLFVVGSAVAIIMLNVTMIKMYHILPWNIYMLVPTFSFGLWKVIDTSLAQVAQCLQLSERMIKEWANDPDMIMGAKLFRKSVKALTPIKLRGGIGHTNFVTLNKRLRCDFDSAIVDSTIALLLAIDID